MLPLIIITILFLVLVIVLGRDIWITYENTTKGWEIEYRPHFKRYYGRADNCCSPKSYQRD